MKDTLNQRIDELIDARNRFDDVCEIKIPSENTCLNVKHFIDLFPNEMLSKITVFTSNDGGLYVHFKTKESKSVIFAKENIFSYVIKKNEDYKITGTLVFSEENIQHISDILMEIIS